MANLIVGDIQGCLQGLQRLLDTAGFNPAVDKLWGVGDLIARGPESLETLAYLYSLGDRFDSVLGNHDLHFLAIVNGIRKAKPNDKLGPLLACAELDRYVDWLRKKPLAVKCTSDVLITHAGLYPKWSIDKAIRLSGEVEQILRGPEWVSLLNTMYGNEPLKWNKSLTGVQRLRFIINAMTRMRFVDSKDNLDFELKCPPEQAPEGLVPWFKRPNPNLVNGQTVAFGHWAALQGITASKQFIGLDTGYVWGNQMTLYIVEEQRFVQVDAVK